MRKDNRIKKSILCMCLVLIFSCSSSFAASSAKEKLTVGVPVNRCPVFYIDEDTEEVVGIGADLIKEVAEAAGYDVVFEIIKEQDLKHALDNDTYDILVPFGSAIKSAKGRSTVISDCIFQTPFTLLTENGKTIPLLNDLRVGMLTSLGGVAETIKEMYPGIEIIKYDTLKDSIKALRAGEVHALLNNSYVWSYVLQKSAYSDLKIQASAVFSMDFTAGAIDIPENRTIIERLNAGIATITDEKRQTVILDYTTRRLYHKTFSDLFYDYWKYVLVGTILFFFIITTVVYRLRMFHMEKEKELQKMIDI
ncbi:MAG: transporter substrate-binding domain-containing protein, partial [Lachnospiraceae bacterium]|nr:transporter substrate-binding domain-containing protein [Lachnospiraceae bacterium]